jgi:CspA family cold shock protein
LWEERRHEAASLGLTIPPHFLVHITAVERAGLGNLNEGQKLTYEIEADRQPGKSSAVNLKGI